MAQSEATLSMVRQVEIQRPVSELEVPAVPLPAPTEEEARAVDEIFAAKTEEPHSFLDAVSFAAAAMLLHDIVKDTLAPPVNEDEDEQPRAKPKPKEES